MRKLECPSCGANLELKEDNRDFAFCEFCGAKITLDDFRSTHHVVDEARLKEAEIEQMIKLKQLEWAEKHEQENARKRQLKTKITIILAVVGGGSFLLALTTNSLFFYSVLAIVFFAGMFILGNDYFDIDKNDSSTVADIGKIRIPDEVDGYRTETYIVIKGALKRAGFTNIKCVALNDLTTGLINKPNTVESITIDGMKYDNEGGAFSPHAEIIITYHSMSGHNAGSILDKAKQTIKEQFSDDNDPGIFEEENVSQTIMAFRMETYRSVKTMLESGGFTNIRCVPLNDLKDKSSPKNNMVEYVTANGTEFDMSKNLSRNVPIIITYHSVAN